MDQSNFSAGTLFETILLINEQISKKLNMRIDLRKDPVLVEDGQDASKNKQKQLEEKLEKYILKFINLNADNDRRLDKQTDKLDGMLEKRIKELDIRLKNNVDDMKQYATVDFEKQKNFRTELEQYVLQLHTMIADMEKKRIEDLDNNLNFITKLKEENFTIKQKQVNYDKMLTKVKLHLTEFNLMRTQERVGLDPDKEKIQQSISQYEKKMFEELNLGLD